AVLAAVEKTLLLLARDRLRLALAGARVGVRALPADGEPAAMAKPAVAGEVHQPLDVHRGFAPEIAFDRVVLVDRLTDVQHLLVGEVLDSFVGRNAELGDDVLGRGPADSVDIGERDFHALVGGDVHPGNSSHLLPFFSAPRGAFRPISSLKMTLIQTKKPTRARVRRR